MGCEDMKPDELLLTVKQVAEALEVSTVTVTRYHREGLLPYVELGKAGRGVRRLTPCKALDGFVHPKPGPKPNVEV